MTNSPSSTRPRWFGTDGIRALAGEGLLAPDAVWRIGRALALFAREHTEGEAPRVLIAMDSRPSGPELIATLAAAMSSEGARVLECGILPTPALAWLTGEGDFDLGIMVSASHNPAPYNGIKPFVDGGRKLSLEEERTIEALLDDLPASMGTPDMPPRDMKARHRYLDATAAWLREEGDLEGLHLVVDLAHGAATTTAPFLLRELGARVTLLHAAGEGVINEACGSEHPEAWLESIADAKPDAALAFDGDADRIILATGCGQRLDGDDILSILAEAAKARGGIPGNTVVSTVMANLGLEDRLAELDARLVRAPVGDRHVAEAMRTTGSAMGGEPSGHIVLPRSDLDGAPLIGDALVAAVRVLQAVKRLDTDLATLRAKRPRHPQKLIGVRVEARRPLESWTALQEAMKQIEHEFDGSGRLVVRYSGTEPLLRIMAEGRDALRVEAAVETLRRVAEAG